MPSLSVGAVFAPCSGLPGRVRAYLDCVSDDLALLLAARGVTDVLAPLAMDLRSDLLAARGSLPRLDLPPAGQSELLARRTGGLPWSLGLAELGNLNLQSWLLARNRLPQARWLAAAGVLAAKLCGRFATQVGGGWQRVREMCYIALRRLRSGRPAPTAVLPALQTVLGDEVRLARELLGLARWHRPGWGDPAGVVGFAGSESVAGDIEPHDRRNAP